MFKNISKVLLFFSLTYSNLFGSVYRDLITYASVANRIGCTMDELRKYGLMSYVRQQFVSWMNECLPGGSAWGGPRGRMIVSSSGIQGLYEDGASLNGDDVARLHRIYEREFPGLKRHILAPKIDEIRQKTQQELLALVKKQSEQIDKLMTIINQIAEQNAQFISFMKSTQQKSLSLDIKSIKN